MIPSVTVVHAGEALRDAAIALARQLRLPHVDQRPPHGLVLEIGPEGLGLLDASAPREQPLRIEFTAGAMGFRQRHGFSKDELLPRAVGIKGGVRPRVLDATAGLGRDAFMLASMGCTVTLYERHPIVHALLKDGLRRAAVHPELVETLARMELLSCDALDGLGNGRFASEFDVVYLDPMFPERTKSALVKKPMRLFHALVGADEDADLLLEKALNVALKRVVVKRPLHAEPLAGKAPDVSYKGKAVRFDAYLTHRG